MGRNAIYGGAGFVLLCVAIGFFAINLAPDKFTASPDHVDVKELSELAMPYAIGVSDFFDNISEKLTAFVSNDSVKSLFERGSEEDLVNAGEAAVSQFNAGLKLRLLRPGQYQTDTSSSPPLSFGSIAMLNKLERSISPVAVEALFFGSDDQHIVYVERVKNQSDQLIGIVHLSLDVSLFLEALNNLGPVQGYLEIQQSVSGASLVLGSVGDSSLKSGAPVSVSVSGTRWTVSYWPPSSSISVHIPFIGNNVPSTLSLGVGVVVLILIGTLIFAKSRKNILLDLDHEGNVENLGPLREIMNAAHFGMKKLFKYFLGGGQPIASQASPSEALEGQDITSIASINSLKAKTQLDDGFDISQGAGDSGEEQDEKPPVKPQTVPVKPVVEIPTVIFRKYDIRGKVENELTAEVVKQIGLAIGTQASKLPNKTIVVGRDGRNSSPELSQNLIEGLTATGCDVIDIGIVPTPVLYFATHHFETGNGVMVTGSHNGPEYNGLKIVLGGDTLSEEKIQELKDIINKNEFSIGNANVSSHEILSEYIRRITEDIPVAFGNSFKLVIDCGNGAASVVASQLYKAMGHDVIDLYCELDGNFPNHHPDPSQPENLEDLINKINETNADLGFAFDGDGDRLGVVDTNGKVLWPDQQMMVFACDVLSRNPGGEIIFDVKCSKHLKSIIEEKGGKPLMWMTGHSLIKSKMKEVGAPLAGEMSGHIFFGERWYGFDDALYSGARMLEILTNSNVKPARFFAELPVADSTPELRIDLPETEHKKFMSDLEAKISFDDAEIITVDGFRVEFSNGWGLIRPSNTTPCLVARFEADSQEALEMIKGKFRELILSVNPEMNVPF
jgi:phosphomannomutase/phosphoglucomutase